MQRDDLMQKSDHRTKVAKLTKYIESLEEMLTFRKERIQELERELERRLSGITTDRDTWMQKCKNVSKSNDALVRDLEQLQIELEKTNERHSQQDSEQQAN